MTRIPLVGLFESVFHFADRTDISEEELLAFKNAAEKEEQKRKKLKKNGRKAGKRFHP